MSWSEVRTSIKAAPQDVETFIVRRAACDHWDGEVGGNFAPRERQIQSERKKLRCHAIDRDEQALRRAYRTKPKLLRLLDVTAEVPPDELPRE